MCPVGSAGVQGAAKVIEFVRTGGKILTLHPSIVPGETGRAVGSVPRLLAGKQIPVGEWESVTPPDHTHSEALCEERAQTERETVGEWLCCHAL